jgi:hypothetical protein
MKLALEFSLNQTRELIHVRTILGGGSSPSDLIGPVLEMPT